MANSGCGYDNDNDVIVAKMQVWGTNRDELMATIVMAENAKAWGAGRGKLRLWLR